MKFLSLWAPVVVQMAIIFGASSMSDPGLPAGVSDRSGHFIGYALLAMLVLRALARGRLAGITWRAALLAILWAAGYGVSDEIHQRFVPGRTPDVADVVADALGACAGAALCLALRAGTRRYSDSPSASG